MQVVDRKKVYADGTDFVIAILQNTEGPFYSEIYEEPMHSFSLFNT